jgi:hypothetical protein
LQKLDVLMLLISDTDDSVRAKAGRALGEWVARGIVEEPVAKHLTSLVEKAGTTVAVAVGRALASQPLLATKGAEGVVAALRQHPAVLLRRHFGSS